MRVGVREKGRELARVERRESERKRRWGWIAVAKEHHGVEPAKIKDGVEWGEESSKKEENEVWRVGWGERRTKGTIKFFRV